MSNQIEINKIVVDQPEVYHISKSAVYEVNDCVTGITLNTIPALTQRSFSNVSFKIDSQGDNQLIKDVSFKFPLKIVVKMKDNREANKLSDRPENLQNAICLSQFSLYRICSLLNVSFNGTSHSINVDRFINALSYYDDLSDPIYSGNSVQPDNGAIDFDEYSDAKHAALRLQYNPFADFGASSTKFVSRKTYLKMDESSDGTYQGYTFSKGFCPAKAKGDFCYQIFTADIELLVPMELFHTHMPGLVNISSLMFDFTFNNKLSRLVSFNKEAINSVEVPDENDANKKNKVYDVDFDSVSNADFESVPNLYYYRVSLPEYVKQNISTNNVIDNIPYKLHKYFTNTMAPFDLNTGESKNFTFNSNTFTYLPKKIFVYFEKNFDIQVNKDMAQTPANYPVITNIKLMIGNNNITYDSVSSMYNLCVKNGLKNCSKYQFENGLVGTVICFDISSDIAMEPLNYTGQPIVTQISCTGTVKNVSKNKLSLSGHMTFVNDNILILGNTSASIRESLDLDKVNKEHIVEHYKSHIEPVALGGKIVGGSMFQNHKNLHGGSFWSGVKNFFGKALRIISNIATPITSILAPEFSGIAASGSKFAGDLASQLGAGVRKASRKVPFKGL